MSHCLNPQCDQPQNPSNANFCQRCGQPLRLKQRYRSLKLLGQGGFGRTFLAEDEQQPGQPRCVIKQFHPLGQPNAGKAIALFQQEAIRLQDLGHHDQIPSLYAHCEEGGKHYIVQQYVDGQNLTQEFQSQGVFNEGKIRSLLLDLLPVLEFIHNGGVIHRDIKPDNIIRRGGDDRLVLVDFGAAKFATATALAQTGTMIGSAEYTAPEQLKGRATLASDLYSLGVTCLHLLTGLSPFDLFDVHEDCWMWRRYLFDNPVSDSLAGILDRLVAGAMKERWPNATAVLAALQSPSAPYRGNPPPLITAEYDTLTQLLAQQQWQAADRETAEILLNLTERDRHRWLRWQDLKAVPLPALQTLDQLWVEASHGLFGFSVQQRIYQRLGGTSRYRTQLWKKFGDVVGWRDRDRWLLYEDLTFNALAPQGHLPRYCFTISGRHLKNWFYGWPQALWFAVMAVLQRFN